MFFAKFFSEETFPCKESKGRIFEVKGNVRGGESPRKIFQGRPYFMSIIILVLQGHKIMKGVIKFEEEEFA